MWLRAAMSTLAALAAFAISTHPVQASSKVRMPEFVGISRWLNTDKPLSRDDLRGRVVLVDFWTYSCVNCIRTLPEVEALHERYGANGLTVIGVHSPEFSFEKDPANVEAAIHKFGLSYPVAMDDDHRTWNAYSNRYWPAQYLVDRNGYVRYQHFGEGGAEETERQIRVLLSEGNPGAPLPPVGPSAAPPPEPITPEIYVGAARISNFGDRTTIRAGTTSTFEPPEELESDRFYVRGAWTFQPQYAVNVSGDASILVRFRATQANMVLEAEGGHPVRAAVLIDGQPATPENRGSDVTIDRNGKAVCQIGNARLYTLAQLPAAQNGSEHTLELRIEGSGVRAYTFTFG